LKAQQPHQALWQQPQRRSTPVMHMAPSPMPLSSMIPTTSAPQSSRPYQPNHVEMMMAPSFPPTSMAPGMSFQPGAYGFDLSATMNQYPVQQSYSMNLQQSVSQSTSYTSAIGDTAGPVSLVRDARNTLPAIARSPTIKSEISSPVHPPPPFAQSHVPEPLKSTTPDTSESGQPSFQTDIDRLMRAIQAKQNPQPEPQAYPEPAKKDTPVPVDIPAEARTKPRKRYQCGIPGCHKSFFQKTHLEIHTRAHTGVKPFVSSKLLLRWRHLLNVSQVCKTPNCSQRFSQLGNLKTHERRHTGERPYNCDVCGKTFAQRGNVRAHKIVHQQIKPFICKLDDCGKQFTQVGNLKVRLNS
jgi:hypothetical protein